MRKYLSEVTNFFAQKSNVEPYPHAYLPVEVEGSGVGGDGAWGPRRQEHGVEGRRPRERHVRGGAGPGASLGVPAVVQHVIG